MVDPTRTLVPVRARQGVGSEAGRDVHLAPLAAGVEASGKVETACGMSLATAQIETVAPGVGMPCVECLINKDNVEPRSAPSARTYRAWGWPVAVRGDQVLLTLGVEVIALVLPVRLAETVTAILAGRDRPVPILIDPRAPDDRVLLAGEPYSIPLPWPTRMRFRTGMLPLPPSITSRGPVRWRHGPTTGNLAECREIDVFSALHVMLRAAEQIRDGAA